MWTRIVLVSVCFTLCYSLSYYSNNYNDESDDISDLYNLPPSEISALYDFYNATGGDYWLWSTNPADGAVWNFSQPNPMPCYEHWQGITCTLEPDNYYHVHTLILDFFNLTGYYPDSIGNLTYIWAFSTQYNAITGSIPQSIGNWSLHEFRLFNVDGNQLTGSILPEFCLFTTLLEIVVDQNQMTGTLPECLGNIPTLAMMLVGSNYFHGTIPASYANPQYLDYFDVSNNMLTGTLPPAAVSLSHYNVGFNPLTGSLPSELGQLSALQSLYLPACQFTNSIPESFGNLSSLLFLIAPANYLTGFLLTTFGNLTDLIGLRLTQNLMSGSFPSTIGPLQQQLVEISLDNNSFSGSLTSSIGQAALLQVFFVYENRFTGSLVSVFNASIQHNLTNIDVSSNMFSGYVPTEPFKIQSLISFAAVSNCIHGSLSADLCSADNLLVLSLDGLSTASACQNRYFDTHLKPFSEIHSYGLKYSVTNSIPVCLFNMKSLQTLHLSGNDIIDTLTSDQLVLSPTLSDLSLSHNQLYGSIPVSFQQHNWSNLDLSYNNLYGMLILNYPTPGHNASLSLQVNRLSGPIPHNLVEASDISMLDGNLFGCRGDRSDLPTNDPDVDIYECGSNSFNYTIYVWLGLISLSMGGLLFLGFPVKNDTTKEHSSVSTSVGKVEEGKQHLVNSQSLTKSVSDWLNALDTHRSISDNVKPMTEFCTLVRQIYFSIASFVIIVLMPVYIVLTHYYRTYSYEYAWTVTGIYLSGVTPTVVLFLLFLVLFGLSVWLFIRLSLKDTSIFTLQSDTSQPQQHQQSPAQERFDVKSLLLLSGVVLLNVVVVIGANVAYVYIEHNYDSVSVKLTQIALAGFKLVWYGLFIRRLLKQLRLTHFNQQSEGSSLNVNQSDSSSHDQINSRYTSIELFIVLFNNLAAPFVAVAFVSSDCFYNVFTSPPSVDATYSFYTCEHETISTMNPNTTVCEIENGQTISTSYVPPFAYSYQCSSVYIATYSPIFVFTFIIIAFASPLFQSLMLYLVNRQTNKQSSAYKYSLLLLSSILQPIDEVEATNNKDLCLFESDLFVVRLINAFSILFTFGTVVPPLAVIGFVSMFNYSYFVQLTIGRFLFNVPWMTTTTHNTVQELLFDRLNQECAGVSKLFTNSITMVIPFVVCFYGLFLFDLLGSSVGSLDAFWAPILIVLVPSIVCIVLFVFQKWIWTTNTERRRLSSLGNTLKSKSELNEKLGQSLMNNEF